MINLHELTVRDAYNLDPGHSLLVSPGEDFPQIIEHFANFPELRGIFVTDTDQCLLGVITRTDLLDWANARLAPFLRVTHSSMERTIRLSTLVNALTAEQVMVPDSHRAAVKLDDSLAHSLQLMIELSLVVLPVVDDTNHVVGDLRLSELLARAIGESAKSIR